MADIYETRRERLRQLIEERYDWNQSTCAKALGISRTSISDYASGAKTIGNRVAGNIESEAHLPTGWLDTHDPDRKPVTRVFLRGRRPCQEEPKRKPKRSQRAAA